MPRLTPLIAAAICAALLAVPARSAAADQAKPPPPLACRLGAPALRQERALRRQVRRVRARWGLAHVRGNSRLTRAARRHSHRLVARGLFEHSARLPYGRTRAAGQNLARAWSARQALRLMLHSPPHRRTLLDRRWRSIGVGAARDCRGMVTFTLNLAAGPPR